MTKLKFDLDNVKKKKKMYLGTRTYFTQSFEVSKSQVYCKDRLGNML